MVHGASPAVGALSTVLLWCVQAAASPVATPATERIELRSMTAAQALEVHERVLGKAPGGTIVAAPKGDAVLVRDTPERLGRYRALLAWLDLPVSPTTKAGKKAASELSPGRVERRIYVRPVVHRLASELVTVVRRIFGDSLGRDVAFAPDDRSGQLVVRARAHEYAEIDRLLRRLDVHPRGERRIFVLPGSTALPLPGDSP